MTYDLDLRTSRTRGQREPPSFNKVSVSVPCQRSSRFVRRLCPDKHNRPTIYPTWTIQQSVKRGLNPPLIDNNDDNDSSRYAAVVAKASPFTAAAGRHMVTQQCVGGRCRWSVPVGMANDDYSAVTVIAMATTCANC